MIADFWAKVKRGNPEECWPWIGYTVLKGYGLTSYKSMPMYASRKAWILTHGPISSEMCVCHKCDNPVCCNPSHLYAGSRADNMIDRFTKISPQERSARGRATILTTEQLEELWQMRQDGAHMKDCAEKFHVHLATIYRYITSQRKVKLEKLRADKLIASQK